MSASPVLADEFLTLGKLDEMLNEVGLSIGVLSTDPQPRLDFEKRGDRSARMILVVTVLVKNAEGNFYLDGETREPATETRRFAVTENWRLVPVL